ncbi:hypothetical protein KGF56_004223 [Candida oxycetoniae]|uniref:Uncharacterized protein n=1 Tax=Candida oxycetoniae TaxID=497107 RepID=A0AAI9SU76_9ASCO|nr:uncharacterized protein KGF56_004223 [Candida oxycetoniae]KAI3402970.1 hypothetical protein KGF56_004223 [Candida oxycetoniae]
MLQKRDVFRRLKSSSVRTPSFHRKNANAPVKVKSKHQQGLQEQSSITNTTTSSSPFTQELLMTGRPNWDKAPSQLKQRYRGIFLVLLSIPIIAVTSFVMYQRLEGKSTKKIQQGELLENGTKRDFDEAEKYKVEKESFMYKIFGRDFFLDGFTSKTMKNDQEQEEKKNTH